MICSWYTAVDVYSEEATGRGHSPPSRHLCTKCNSLPINGQCTNHRIAV